MSFRNFTLAGEELIAPFARQEPHRCARLIQALEHFIDLGPGLGTRVVEKEHVVVFLVPPRSVLRGVPDAAALVVADLKLEQLELVDVLREFGGDDSAPWAELCRRAAAHIE